MRQGLKERRNQLRGGIPTPRVLTLVLMLAIMGLIFVRVRDPSTWRWFTRDDDDGQQVVARNDPAKNKQLTQTSEVAAEAHPQAPAGSTQAASGPPQAAGGTTVPQQVAGGTPAPLKAAKTTAQASSEKAGNPPTPPEKPKTPPEMTPTGSTDLDPMEWEDMKTNISLVEDGTFEVNKLEAAAYFQILNWVDHQPVELLRKRAHKDVVYSDFRRAPNSMRLQIVELKLHVIRVLRCFDPPVNGVERPVLSPEGKPIYELLGVSQDSGSNLYFGIVTDLPEGMQIGPSVDEYARLVGYFFKLQGYVSLEQEEEAERTRKKPITLKAPVIVGRVVLIGGGSAAEAEEKTPFWLLAAILSVAVAVAVGWVAFSMRRLRRRNLPAITPRANLDPAPPSIDNWLDQAQSGRITLEPVPESTRGGDETALEGPLEGRLSGNIFGENGESSNGHSVGGQGGSGHGGGGRSGDGEGGADPGFVDREP